LRCARSESVASVGRGQGGFAEALSEDWLAKAVRSLSPK